MQKNHKFKKPFLSFSSFRKFQNPTMRQMLSLLLIWPHFMSIAPWNKNNFMKLIIAIANSFSVTPFDVMFFLLTLVAVFALYYFVPLRRLYEIAFGAIVGLGIYVLLYVLLLENTTLGTSGWLLPFGMSVFIISIAIYLVLILAIIFPLHGWLVLSETTNPILYTLQYLFVGFFLIIGFCSVIIYMTEQVYLFRVWTIFVWLRDTEYYINTIRFSAVFRFIMTHQNIIIPLAVLLMVYKLFLSNIVSAIVLTIVYNLSRVGFYKKKEESSYRVEFHEVWAPTAEENHHIEDAHHH